MCHSPEPSSVASVALNDIDKIGSEGGDTVKVGPIFLKGVFRTLFYKSSESQTYLMEMSQPCVSHLAHAEM